MRAGEKPAFAEVVGRPNLTPGIKINEERHELAVGCVEAQRCPAECFDHLPADLLEGLVSRPLLDPRVCRWRDGCQCVGSVREQQDRLARKRSGGLGDPSDRVRRTHEHHEHRGSASRGSPRLDQPTNIRHLNWMGSQGRDEIGAQPRPAGPDHDVREGEFHGRRAWVEVRWRSAMKRGNSTDPAPAKESPNTS